LKELIYWNHIAAEEVEPLRVDSEAESRYLKQEYLKTIDVGLSAEETEDLLTKVNWAYNTEINDLLLTALSLALGQWSGLKRAAVNLEGHGREPIITGIDVSRTVGWFTSQYPVLLDLTYTNDISLLLKHVKETLRRIPHKGIGYGILRYLTPPDKLGDLEFRLSPEISFNYLGKFGESRGTKDSGGDTGGGGFIRLSDIGTGDSLSPGMEQHYLLNINGMIMGTRLSLFFSHNPYQFETESIQRLADLYLSALRAIIHHCKGQTKKQPTPSDLGRPEISLEEFDTISKHVADHIGRDTEISRIYPLSPMQSGMLYHSLENEAGHAYFEQSSFNLEGDIHADLLHKCFNLLLEKYEVLRTVFLYDQLDQPLQVVPANREAPLIYEDISGKSEKERDAFLENFRLRDLETGFRLSRDILMRIALFRTGDHLYTLVWSFHHILMDGWCLGIIYKELLAFYHALRNGETPALGSVTPYSEYIKWLHNQDMETGYTFWERYLSGFSVRTGLPTAAFTGGDYRVEEHWLLVPEELSAQLYKSAAHSRVTVNTLFQTLWGILLQHYNNTDDVLFGAVVSGRPPGIPGIESIVGLFINTIPVRITANDLLSFSRLLTNVQQESIQLKSHEYLPLAEIQSRSLQEGNLFDHIMVFENAPVQQETSGAHQGLEFNLKQVTEVFEQTGYDFNLLIIPGRSLSIKMSYNALVYTTPYIEKVGLHLLQLLHRVADDPGVLLGDIEILTPEEKEHVLFRINHTETPYPAETTLHGLFEEQVEKTPSNPALVFDTGSRTYGELNRQVCNLARKLQRTGVGPNFIVAIMMERSPGMITAILAILKAGGAYLPIDPGYPENRKKYILRDSCAHVLITSNEPATDNPSGENCEPGVNNGTDIGDGTKRDIGTRLDFHKAILRIPIFPTDYDDYLPENAAGQQDTPDALTGQYDDHQPVPNQPHHMGSEPHHMDRPPLTGSADMAYIIYTSGTTGLPKGVVIEHRSAVNTLCALHRRYPLEEGDTYLFKTSFVFDVSV
ncbi:MAG: AMP-binding protein, partial [bacterium]|nr:AMP-binding protein [bacterium]